MILTSTLTPTRPQNDPNTIPKRCLFHLRFMLRFWHVFDSILAPFGEPFEPQNPLKIHLDFFQKITSTGVATEVKYIKMIEFSSS